MKTNIFMTSEEGIKAFSPGLISVEMANTLGGAADDLLSTISDKYVSKCQKILAPVDKFTMDASYEFQAGAWNKGKQPVVQVEVVDSVGTVQKNATSWTATDIDNDYIDVKVDRYSLPFTLTFNDLRHGERIETKVGEGMEQVAQAIVADIVAKMKAATPANIEVSALDPETVASEISTAFGDEACSTLLVNPANFGGLVPTNALALDPAAAGVYGIEDGIFRCAGVSKAHVTGSTNDAVAVAIAKNGIITASGSLPWEQLTKYGSVEVRPLANVYGIQMFLKTAVNPDTEGIMCSIEAALGSAVIADRVKTVTASA